MLAGLILGLGVPLAVVSLCYFNDRRMERRELAEQERRRLAFREALERSPYMREATEKVEGLLKGWTH